MYKHEEFSSIKEMMLWLNENKNIDIVSITCDGYDFFVFYWEEEPQPQQKDLIPESDKK